MQFEIKLMKSLYGSWNQTPAIQMTFINERGCRAHCRQLAIVTKQEVRYNEKGSTQGSYVHPAKSDIKVYQPIDPNTGNIPPDFPSFAVYKDVNNLYKDYPEYQAIEFVESDIEEPTYFD